MIEDMQEGILQIPQLQDSLDIKFKKLSFNPIIRSIQNFEYYSTCSMAYLNIYEYVLIGKEEIRFMASYVGHNSDEHGYWVTTTLEIKEIISRKRLYYTLNEIL